MAILIMMMMQMMMMMMMMQWSLEGGHGWQPWWNAVGTKRRHATADDHHLHHHHHHRQHYHNHHHHHHHHRHQVCDDRLNTVFKTEDILTPQLEDFLNFKLRTKHNRIFYRILLFVILSSFSSLFNLFFVLSCSSCLASCFSAMSLWTNSCLSIYYSFIFIIITIIIVDIIFFSAIFLTSGHHHHHHQDHQVFFHQGHFWIVSRLLIDIWFFLQTFCFGYSLSLYQLNSIFFEKQNVIKRLSLRLMRTSVKVTIKSKHKNSPNFSHSWASVPASLDHAQRGKAFFNHPTFLSLDHYAQWGK